MWSLKGHHEKLIFHIFDTANVKRVSSLASLHKNIKGKQQEARLCPSRLAYPLMLHVKVVAINSTGCYDKRAEDSDWLKWSSRI